MNEWAELDRALGVMVESGAIEVREDGEWLAELGGLHCQLREQGKSALVHLWSDERNLTRRVLRVREQSDDRIVLEVQRFGRAKPGRLEFLRTESARPAVRVNRERFRARLRRILTDCFPDATIDLLAAAPDLEHSFSGVYVRGRMRETSQSWAVLAMSPDESAAAIECALAFGLLWLDWTRSHTERHAIKGLRIFVPEGASKFFRGRIAALSPDARVEIFELSEPEGRLQEVDVADAGNLESWLVPRREMESACAEARRAIGQIHGLAVHLPPAGNEILLRPIPGTGEVSLCFRGLEFGQWSRGGILFGLGDSREKLTDSNQAALDRLIRRLDSHRSMFADDTNHALYRAAPERWLETIVLQDPTRLDAQLDPGCLYSQVPAVTAGDRGVIDLLGVTRRGRLVVIELKASEDVQLPMQAIDYWQRVRRHQLDGDFERYGYFGGVRVDSNQPLLWLVAPGLRFHPSTETLLRYLSPDIQITRIGLSENWRRDLKIVFRQ
ncbi:MAG TPA: hypothetical protein VEJ38_02615 [Candidatus Acidoferrales bacterium]|nr:hypothetical protein [Candidatus Acidoferrales bacterium]